MQLMSVAGRFVTRGSTVWDIGSNVGVFAIAAAHAAGPSSRILAVEPDPFLAHLLQRTLWHGDNHDLQVSVLCQAIANSNGLSRFVIAERGRSTNALEQSRGGTRSGGARLTQYVPTTTLDSIRPHFGSPNFIKVDVEGAESLVLEGAEQILAECRPVLYVEVGSEQRDHVTDVFKRHRYRLYDGDATDGRELQTSAWNTLAVPAESDLTNRGHDQATQRKAEDCR